MNRPAVINPPLRPVLKALLWLFALLMINAVYLLAVRATEAWAGVDLQGYGYLLMFLAHLALGLLITIPLLVFGPLHFRRARRHRNRDARRAGLALYFSALILLISGLLLTRFGVVEINDAGIRKVSYWLHVITPVVVIWLFILHRLAGPPLRWRYGIRWATLAATATVLLISIQAFQSTTQETLLTTFSPSPVQFEGDPNQAEALLMQDKACAQCHPDIARQAALSMHKLSSFNNPAYRLSIDEARRVLLQRDGNVQAARLCASCHDLVPLFSGKFDQPDYDPDLDASGHSGITCLGCHAITTINSVRGNADYRLKPPTRYPFADSQSPLLQAVHRQLIRAKPELHKKSLLKPLHQSTEFCGSCHKVNLPYALNHYRWLRGQNHYDSFMQSGVSGHRVDSFYYPGQAIATCASCHMPLTVSDDPAARDINHNGKTQIHHHEFAVANTAVPYLMEMPESTIKDRQSFLKGIARIDLFGLREHGEIDGKLSAPLQAENPELEAGKRYLLETVIRTLKVGHHLSQGTSDSNQLWLELTVRNNGKIIGQSGAMNPQGRVDPGSYFVNSYLLDKKGHRIDRRNAHDIVVALYDHQIPPGAASVVHYQLNLPAQLSGAIEIEARLLYRKFDNQFMAYLHGDNFSGNTLPITEIASTRIEFSSKPATTAQAAAKIPPWERWNDYGIGLLRQGNSGANKGALRQAETAFKHVAALGKSEGSINLARVYFKEGRLEDTISALQTASTQPNTQPWVISWYTALVQREYGELDKAAENLEQIIETRFKSARERGFDFSGDIRVNNMLGRVRFEQARTLRGKNNAPARTNRLNQSVEHFQNALKIDPEDLTAHNNMALVYRSLGELEPAKTHQLLAEKYRPDDHAREHAVTLHRSRNPAADHAAADIAIYNLVRTQD